MIRRCKTLLWFPHKYRDILLQKGGKISTDFFIELYPIAYRLSNENGFSFPFGTERLVDKMIDKFLNQRTIYDVKEFRDIRKAMGFYDKSGNISEFVLIFDQFIENADLGLEVFETSEIEDDRSRKNIMRYISFLNSSLPEINTDLISDYIIVDQLKQLYKIVQDLIDTID